MNFHLEFAHEGVDDPSPNQVDALPPCSPKVGAHTNLEGDEEKRMWDLKLKYPRIFKQDSE